MITGIKQKSVLIVLFVVKLGHEHDQSLNCLNLPCNFSTLHSQFVLLLNIQIVWCSFFTCLFFQATILMGCSHFSCVDPDSHIQRYEI